MASGQAVRRRALDAEIVGSNPTSPAKVLLQIRSRPILFGFLFLPIIPNLLTVFQSCMATINHVFKPYLVQ